MFTHISRCSLFFLISLLLSLVFVVRVDMMAATRNAGRLEAKLVSATLFVTSDVEANNYTQSWNPF